MTHIFSVSKSEEYEVITKSFEWHFSSNLVELFIMIARLCSLKIIIRQFCKKKKKSSLNGSLK